jgi:hypothetical protein
MKSANRRMTNLASFERQRPFSIVPEEGPWNRLLDRGRPLHRRYYRGDLEQ